MATTTPLSAGRIQELGPVHLRTGQYIPWTRSEVYTKMYSNEEVPSHELQSQALLSGPADSHLIKLMSRCMTLPALMLPRGASTQPKRIPAAAFPIAEKVQGSGFRLGGSLGAAHRTLQA